MRILVVSNLYPPDALGGYELLCADSAQRWARQGHAVTVLTRASSAIAAATSGSGEPRVVRTFRPRPAEPARGGKAVRAWWLRRERRIIEGAVRELRPELIATWGTYGIAPSAISGVYGAGVPTIAFAQDYTLIEHLNRPAPDAAADPLRRAYARALSSLAGERWPRP